MREYDPLAKTVRLAGTVDQSATLGEAFIYENDIDENSIVLTRRSQKKQDFDMKVTLFDSCTTDASSVKWSTHDATMYCLVPRHQVVKAVSSCSSLPLLCLLFIFVYSVKKLQFEKSLD